jgi:hypothetical protein
MHVHTDSSNFRRIIDSHKCKTWKFIFIHFTLHPPQNGKDTVAFMTLSGEPSFDFKLVLAIVSGGLIVAA